MKDTFKVFVLMVLLLILFSLIGMFVTRDANAEGALPELELSGQVFYGYIVAEGWEDGAYSYYLSETPEGGEAIQLQVLDDGVKVVQMVYMARIGENKLRR